MHFDLLITDGDVLDPDSRTRRTLDIGIADGRIVALDVGIPRESAREVVDAAGLLVTPGLIDLHVHAFAGQDLGVDPGSCGLSSGTTTLVDAGSAGAHLFEAFRSAYIEPARERVLAFLNISTIGTTSILLGGELENLRYASLDACVACIEDHPDLLVGVKVRASVEVVGANGLESVRIARAASDRLSLPLMVHIGPSPPAVDQILPMMRGGDVLTHCFTGWDNRLLDAHGHPRAEVWAAKERGVLFDVGHGMAGFDCEVAAQLMSQGILPDTISTDLHAYSVEWVRDLPTTLSKFLALGMSLEEVISCATNRPAGVIGRSAQLGAVRVGALADLSLFEIEKGLFRFTDSPAFGTPRHEIIGRERLRCRATIKEGSLSSSIGSNPVVTAGS